MPAQSIQLEGFITDSLENPLVNTKVIVTPLLEANGQIKFSISSSKGEYRLRLESNQPYLIEVKPQCSKKKRNPVNISIKFIIIAFYGFMNKTS